MKANIYDSLQTLMWPLLFVDDCNVHASRNAVDTLSSDCCFFTLMSCSFFFYFIKFNHQFCYFILINESKWISLILIV